MQLLGALGLDLKVFLAQLINFAILYFVLAKVAIPKIMKMMKDRQDEIDAGLKNAEEAGSALEKAKAQEEMIVSQARSEAATIIKESRQKCKKTEEKIVQEAKEQAQKILKDGEKQVQTEKEKMMLEAKAELAEIVKIGLKNLTDKEVDAKKIKDDYLRQGLVS